MSGPHHQGTATGPEHKEQHNSSRIQISHLLCSIEAAEPAKSAPWDSPRTEALHLEDPSQQRNQHRILQQPADMTRKSEQQQHQDSDSDSDAEEQYDHHPFTSPLSAYNKTAVESSPVNHLAKHFSYSSSLTSPLGRAGGREPLSRSIIPERDSPASSPATTSETGFFNSRPAPSGQRSASLSTNYYHDQLHPYEVELAQKQRRSDRSKSDYALHQQNYGPYLDASPTLPSATLFSSSRPPTYPQHGRDINTPPPSQPKASYFREYVTSPEDHSRPPYPSAHTSYGPIQSDSRRPSQGIMLPPPDAMLTLDTKKSARIYGRDAADGPALPSFASFAANPSSYDASEQNRMDYAPRPSTHNADKGYGHYSDEGRLSSVSYPHDSQSRYQSSSVDRPSYDHASYDSRRPSAAALPAPAPQPRSDRDAHSPRMDIKPPVWYQQYAHATPSKPQPRPSYAQGDVSLYSSRDRRESGAGPSMDPHAPSWYQQYSQAVPYKPQARAQEDSSHYASRDRRESGVGPSAPLQAQSRVPTESWSAKSVLPLTPPISESDQRRMSSSVGGAGVDGYGHSLSKPGPKNPSHSVHPFDMPVDTPPSPSKGTKRDREQEEESFAPEDGVKAKRKRANAEQLSVLNAAFERSYFPSTEERLRLSKQTKMCPRTVQIWFQNKRQSVKARTDAMDAAVASTLSGRRRASQAVDRPSLEERRLDDRRQNRGGIGEMMGGHHRQTSSPLSQSTTNPHTTPTTVPIQHGEKRRRSGPLTPADPEMAVETLQIQLDGRSVDYFSRKRRATIAKMELNQSP
ncbi:hypothetical protein BGW39_010115 [Mortierella sp. 14UC]|nr:hypothetical protein BGW39_010115 [Mortierella sp. 14UC]